MALAFTAVVLVPAEAAPIWQQAGSGAAAILPVPLQSDGIVGASLSCAEQEWTLMLRTGTDWRNHLRTGDAAAAAITGTAEVAIGRSRFPMSAVRTGGGIALTLPYKALQPVRNGAALSVTITGEAGPASAQFPLSGSKRVLDAIEPMCSPRSMDGYNLVTLSDTAPAVVAARTLLQKDIEAFKLATTIEPRVEAAEMPLPDGKAMLFARLCGSSWYFGRSGCAVSAFLRAPASQNWQIAYENEGSTSYLEAQTGNDGWPNIVSVPLKGKPDLSVWRWSGGVYSLDAGLVAASSDTVGAQSELE